MKTFLNTFRIVSVIAVLTVCVSYVFAWSEPGANPPSNNAAPIHTGESVQEKKGSIWSKKVIASPIALFKKSVFLPGNASALRIGSKDSAAGSETFTKGSAGAITQDLNTALFGETDTIPLVIDLYARSEPQSAIEFKTDQSCPVATRFSNDKAAAFEFKKENGSRANIIARQVQLTGGNPDANDVLISDAQGNARWAKASVVNGQVVFSPGTSPVPVGQTCVVPNPQIDICQNIDNTQTTVPLNMVQEGVNCICDDGFNLIGGVCEPIPEPETFAIGCFLENTQVTLANGSKKDIEDIKVGDRLQSVSGINTVQKLLRPKLGNQPVYSINKSVEFFTANHPFLTTNGWKSIDPETTRIEIPDLYVTQMKVGDTLITDNGNIIITSITSKIVSPDTQLYNFELDGDHTYYANGYAVHNKEQVPPNNPNPSCDLDQSTLRSDCTELNNYYCSISSGNTQGQCIPSRRCTVDSDCAIGPTIGVVPDQVQLVNGRCLMPTSWVHPADQNKKFCKWN